MPIASATISRSCTGTKVAPKTGAARKAAPGRIIATSHSQSCASTPAKPVGHHRVELGNPREDLLGEVDQQHQDRAAEHGQADADDDQLRHEGQRLLVDRGRRLDHAEHQAGEQAPGSGSAREASARIHSACWATPMK